ncbi:phosphopeptide-binding protein [Micromonospora qiuiae]|uniref:Phosphopeptide-binding protein n=1 Tax=Micromonospora qiuiae TaxID=502268 RepID=A0ABQ4JCD1_9ACTN|nr:FHA domain-containing protein [Micromonospora qiuiae]GIJ27752.1 phosphopeptide-binding protein [Micromonospora qiuiae]
MPELVITVARFGFLILLWIFVFTVVGVIRRDLFAGARSGRLVAAPRTVGASTGQATARPAKVKRGRAAHQLVVTAGQLAGTRITLGEAQITIGRAEDSTLVITDDYASARHARLVPRDGQWFVEDLGSTNGTYLDRAKVTGPTPVPLGVPIRIGRTSLELRP